MDILIFFLFLASLSLLVIGLLDPGALKFLLKPVPTRTRAAAIFGPATALLFVAFTFAVDTPDEMVVIEPVFSGPHQVVRVIDGDTIEVDFEGRVEAVRLIGIDAPETHPAHRPECFGLESTERAKALLEGKTVLLEPDSSQANRDRFGRLLRYVHLDDGTNFNLQMVAEGYAYEYTHGDLPYRYQAEFRAAQTEARGEGRGLWSPDTCDGQRLPPLVPGPDLPVKMSGAGICHAPGTTYYDITINFMPYESLQECLDAGGRLPRR